MESIDEVTTEKCVTLTYEINEEDVCKTIGRLQNGKALEEDGIE